LTARVYNILYAVQAFVERGADHQQILSGKRYRPNRFDNGRQRRA